jgi:hypothetical protein
VHSNLDGEWVDGTGGAIGDRYIDGQFVRPEQLDEIG